jgi:hypothetical protein
VRWNPDRFRAASLPNRRYGAKRLEAAETAFDDIAGFAELASKAGGLPSAFDRAVRGWPSDRPFPK